jgi:thrombospondin type 3 repeat protein
VESVWRVVVLACCTAACNFGGPKAGDQPADGSIDMVGGEGVGDRDHDGIPDDVDNCPDVANPGQENHDGDIHGDACDLCPMFASATDPDRDGDGVGDACDPNPNTPGDKRVLWMGFYDSDAAVIADPTKFTQSAGSLWSVSGGYLHEASANALDVLRSKTVVTNAVIFTSMKIDDFSATNAAAAVLNGVVATPTDVPQFYQCALFKQTMKLGARTHDGGTTTSDATTDWNGPLSNGSTIDFVTRFTTQFECSAALPMTTIQSVTGSSTTGVFELLGQSARISFDYLFVVQPGS